MPFVIITSLVAIIAGGVTGAFLLLSPYEPLMVVRMENIILFVGGIVLISLAGLFWYPDKTWNRKLILYGFVLSFISGITLITTSVTSLGLGYVLFMGAVLLGVGYMIVPSLRHSYPKLVPAGSTADMALAAGSSMGGAIGMLSFMAHGEISSGIFWFVMLFVLAFSAARFRREDAEERRQEREKQDWRHASF